MRAWKHGIACVRGSQLQCRVYGRGGCSSHRAWTKVALVTMTLLRTGSRAGPRPQDKAVLATQAGLEVNVVLIL